MKSLEATIRNSKTKGDINSLRQNGDVPAIIYGGTEENQKISLSKKIKSYGLSKFIKKFFALSKLSL